MSNFQSQIMNHWAVAIGSTGYRGVNPAVRLWAIWVIFNLKSCITGPWPFEYRL